MTTLVVPQDLLDAGFKKTAFDQTDDTAFNAWLQKIIDKCEQEIIQNVGGAAVFATLTATDPEKTLLTKGEQRLVEADLWSRRIIALDNMAVSNRDIAFAATLRRYEEQATAADEEAWNYIGQATGQFQGSTVASGSIETGNFPSVTGQDDDDGDDDDL